MSSSSESPPEAPDDQFPGWERPGLSGSPSLHTASQHGQRTLDFLNHRYVAEQVPVQTDEVACKRLIMLRMSGVGHRQDLCPVSR